MSDPEFLRSAGIADDVDLATSEDFGRLIAKQYELIAEDDRTIRILEMALARSEQRERKTFRLAVAACICATIAWISCALASAR